MSDRIFDEDNNEIFYPEITEQMISNLKATINFNDKLSFLQNVYPVLQDLRYGSCPFSIENMTPPWDECLPDLLSIDDLPTQQLLAPFIALVEKIKLSPHYPRALLEHNEWKKKQHRKISSPTIP